MIAQTHTLDQEEYEQLSATTAAQIWGLIEPHISTHKRTSTQADYDLLMDQLATTSAVHASLLLAVKHGHETEKVLDLLERHLHTLMSVFNQEVIGGALSPDHQGNDRPTISLVFSRNVVFPSVADARGIHTLSPATTVTAEVRHKVGDAFETTGFPMLYHPSRIERAANEHEEQATIPTSGI